MAKVSIDDFEALVAELEQLYHYDVDNAPSEIDKTVSFLRQAFATDTNDVSSASAYMICSAVLNRLETYHWHPLQSVRFGNVVVLKDVLSAQRLVSDQPAAQLDGTLCTLLAYGCLHDLLVQAGSPPSQHGVPFLVRHYSNASVLVEPSSFARVLRLVRRLEALHWVLHSHHQGQGAAGKQLSMSGLALTSESDATSWLCSQPMFRPLPSSHQGHLAHEHEHGRGNRAHSVDFVADKRADLTGHSAAHAAEQVRHAASFTGAEAGSWEHQQAVEGSEGAPALAKPPLSAQTQASGRQRSASDAGSLGGGGWFDFLAQPASVLSGLLSVPAPGLGSGRTTPTPSSAPTTKGAQATSDGAATAASDQFVPWSPPSSGAAQRVADVSALLHAIETSPDPAAVIRGTPLRNIPPAFLSHRSDLSRVLTDTTLCCLEVCLPAPARGYSWSLSYSLTRDGASVERMVTCVTTAQQLPSCGNEYSILVIKDEHGGVFGCFCASSWSLPSMQRTAGSVLGRYFGDQTCWLFTCEPREGADAVRNSLMQRISSWEESDEEGSNSGAAARGQAGGSGSGAAGMAVGSEQEGRKPVHVYKRTGRNAYFQYVEVSKGGSLRCLGMGGGGHFGVYLDQHLEHGRSGPCATFLSPSLCSLECMRSEATQEVVDPHVQALTGATSNETSVASESSSDPSSLSLPGSGRSSGSTSDADLQALGPDVAFRAVEVEVWTLHRRVNRDVKIWPA